MILQYFSHETMPTYHFSFFNLCVASNTSSHIILVLWQYTSIACSYLWQK